MALVNTRMESKLNCKDLVENIDMLYFMSPNS